MIMKNNSSDFENDKSGDYEPNRWFTKILKVAKHHWDEFLTDLCEHTASGLLSTTRGVAHTASLSFDDNEKRLSLAIQLRFPNAMTPSQLQTFLKFQNRNNFGSSFITFDGEDHAFRVMSKSVVPNPETSEFIVDSLFSDILKILEDSDLIQLWN